MHRLKELEKNSLRGAEISIKNVENFEPYWQYNFKWGGNLNKNEIGTVVSVFSTGSRAAYEDYSGYFYFDQLTHGVSIGTFLNFQIKEYNHSNFNFGLGISFINSYYSFQESTMIYEDLTSDEFNAWSIGADINFNFSYRYKFGRFFIQPEAGLLLNIYNTTLKAGGNKLYYENDGKDKALKVNWSGLRAGVGVGYFFN